MIDVLLLVQVLLQNDDTVIVYLIYISVKKDKSDFWVQATRLEDSVVRALCRCVYVKENFITTGHTRLHVGLWPWRLVFCCPSQVSPKFDKMNSADCDTRAATPVHVPSNALPRAAPVAAPWTCSTNPSFSALFPWRFLRIVRGVKSSLFFSSHDKLSSFLVLPFFCFLTLSVLLKEGKNGAYHRWEPSLPVRVLLRGLDLLHGLFFSPSSLSSLVRF